MGDLSSAAARPKTDGGVVATIVRVVLGALVVLAVGVGVLLLVGRVLLDVFSFHGLAYTVGLADGDGLFLAPLVRVFTIVLVVEGFAVGSAVCDWREADEPIITIRGWWALGHATALRRIVRRVGWWGRGVPPLLVQLRRRTRHVSHRAALVERAQLTPTRVQLADPVDEPADVVRDLPRRDAA